MAGMIAHVALTVWLLVTFVMAALVHGRQQVRYFDARPILFGVVLEMALLWIGRIWS